MGTQTRATTGKDARRGHARPRALTGVREHWQAFLRVHIRPDVFGESFHARPRAPATDHKAPEGGHSRGHAPKGGYTSARAPAEFFPVAAKRSHMGMHRPAGARRPQASRPRGSHGEPGERFSALPVALRIPARSGMGRFLHTTAESQPTNRPKLHC